MILDHENVLMDKKELENQKENGSDVFDFGATSWGGTIGNHDGDWEIVVSLRDDAAPVAFSADSVIKVYSSSESTLGDDDILSVKDFSQEFTPGVTKLFKIPSRVLRDAVGRYLQVTVTPEVSATPVYATVAIVLASPRNNVTL